MRTTWSATQPADQQVLRERLTTLVERRSGGPMFGGYPIVNKIVELRLIGRRYRSTH